jgi:hypothetical protein
MNRLRNRLLSVFLLVSEGALTLFPHGDVCNFFINLWILWIKWWISNENKLSCGG